VNNLVDDLGKFIEEQANKTGDVMSQLGRKGIDFSTLPVFIRNELVVGNYRIQEKQQNIAGNTLIWGNADFGIWGSYYWGSSAQTSFILGHSVAGVLGTNILGSNVSDFEIIAVHNDNDKFPEGFWNDRFIDSTNSTGSHFLDEEYYQLNVNETLQSTHVAKENKIYKSVLITLNTEYATGSFVGSDAINEIQIDVSNDGGTSWQTVTEGIVNNLSDGTTDGLKVRFTNVGGDVDTISIPITIPIEFGSTTINIKEYNVKYYS